MTASLPQEISERILMRSDHPLSAGDAPPDLVRLSHDYHLSVTWGDVTVSGVIIPALSDLMNAASAAGVYAREVANYGAQVADTESARPGMSQHQLGTAVDVGSITNEFASTPAGQFLAAYAWEYGFSLSYPRGFEQLTGYRYESWHYRYITRAGTALQREYFDDVQQYMLDFFHENQATLRVKRAR